MDNQGFGGGFFLRLFFILFIQVIIRYLCVMFFPNMYLFSMILANLIIAVIFGILSLPPGYRSQFYKIPFFHRYSLVIFVVFTLFDLFFSFS